MNKSELIEAINSTIVANGQKGITAESLNLILNEIANASGGSGGVIVYMGNMDVATLTLSQTEEQKALNAEAFRQIKEGAGIVAIDMSEIIMEDMGMTITYRVISNSVGYVPAETAIAMGMQDEIVILYSENSGDIMLLSDGTIELMPAE